MSADKLVATRISEELHLEVKIKAAKKRTTISAVIRELLTGWVKDNGNGGEDKKD